MTYQEALEYGVITIDDLEKMREGFSLARLDRYIAGKKVTHPVFGVGTIISCRQDMPAIDVAYGDEVHAMLFPHAFMNGVKFENEHVQEYITAKVNIYEATLEWGAAFDEPDCLYALFGLKISQGLEEEAFEYLSRAAQEGEECAQNCILGYCSRRIEDGLLVDDNTLQFAIDLYKKLVDEGDLWAPIMLADYYYVTKNYKTAESYYKLSAENENLDDELRGEEAARLAGMYLSGRYGASREQGIHPNLQRAKKYFEIAAKCGYPCEADLAFVDGKLGIELRRNAMKKMAEKVLAANYSKAETYQYIRSELHKEFGDLWNVLPKVSQIDLVSGCVVYCELYALGDTICEDIDFSAAIIPIVKAAEVVFRQYLCHDYLEYLLETGTSPNVFPRSYPLVKFNEQSKTKVFQDVDSAVFTLGKIQHLIMPPKKREVYPEFLAYAQQLMKGTVGSRATVQDYLIRFAHIMNQFTFDIRNPAAHSDVMPLWQAEICGNEIILVKKILKEFIGNISMGEADKSNQHKLRLVKPQVE